MCSMHFNSNYELSHDLAPGLEDPCLQTTSNVKDVMAAGAAAGAAVGAVAAASAQGYEHY